MGVPKSMSGSKKYQGKFTADEVKIIDKVIKENSVYHKRFYSKLCFFTIEQVEYKNLILKDPKLKKND